LLYVNSELNPVEFFTKTPYGEHVWCQIDNLLIGVCYRSCNTDIVGRENEVELRKVITEVSNTDFVLMGNFNYPDIDWAHNSVKPGATVDTSGFLECLDDSVVTQHVVEPTRGTAVLDLVLTRDPDQISSVDVTETLGSSDHHMVSFVIHHRHESCKNVRSTRDYLKADYSKIRTELATIDWDATLTGSAAECWSCFKEVLQDLEVRYTLAEMYGRQEEKAYVDVVESF